MISAVVCMAATKLTADGLLTTVESDPDTRMDTDLSYEEEDALLSEHRGEDVDLDDDNIPNAQRQERKGDTVSGLKKPSEHKTKEPVGSDKASNERARKRQREEPPKSAKTTGSSDGKRPRNEEELNSIQEKIASSTNSISLLNTHLEKGSCPKTLRYNARANITPDEDFKKDINAIRKKAEQALVGALVKFHHRRVERLKNKYRKLEQAQSRRSHQETNQSSRKTPARNRNANEDENENELAEVLKAKIREVDTLLEQMRSQAKNKKNESYPVVLSDPLVIREEGKRNTTDNKAVKSRKRYERRKIKEKKCFQNNIESRKQHIKNLSNTQLADEQISLLSRGLKFIPTPVTRENIIRRQLLNDFSQFARRMRLKYIFHGNDKEPHPFHVKSDWDPPVQPSVALETFLEEVKFELASIKLNRPIDNLSQGERNALKELSRDQNIVLKKADKGTTT